MIDDWSFDPQDLLPWWFETTDWDGYIWRDVNHNKVDVRFISQHYAGNLRRFLDRNLEFISDNFYYFLDEDELKIIKSGKLYQTLLVIEKGEVQK